MNKTVIEVQVRAVLPTSGGCAVFLGNNEKVFIIYVDQTVGSAITMFMDRRRIFAVCKWLDFPNPIGPRNTVAPAICISRAFKTIASYNG